MLFILTMKFEHLRYFEFLDVKLFWYAWAFYDICHVASYFL